MIIQRSSTLSALRIPDFHQPITRCTRNLHGTLGLRAPFLWHGKPYDFQNTVRMTLECPQAAIITQIPYSDSLIPRSSHNHALCTARTSSLVGSECWHARWREGNRPDASLVAAKNTNRFAGLHVPDLDRAVLRRGGEEWRRVRIGGFDCVDVFIVCFPRVCCFWCLACRCTDIPTLNRLVLTTCD